MTTATSYRQFSYLGYVANFPYEVYKDSLVLFNKALHYCRMVKTELPKLYTASEMESFTLLKRYFSKLKYFYETEQDIWDDLVLRTMRTIASILFGYTYTWPVVYTAPGYTFENWPDETSTINLLADVLAYYFLEFYDIKLSENLPENSTTEVFTKVAWFIYPLAKHLLEKTKGVSGQPQDTYIVGIGCEPALQKGDLRELETYLKELITYDAPRIDILVFPKVFVVHASKRVSIGLCMEEPCFDDLKLTEPISKLEMSKVSTDQSIAIYYVPSVSQIANQIANFKVLKSFK